MDKQEAFYHFWNSFEIPAYDENSVPDDAVLPYISYQVILDDIDRPVYTNTSVWYDDTSWQSIDSKVAEISSYIEGMLPIKIDGGYMYIARGTPFAQRLSDETDNTKKRYVLNLQIEFLTQN